MSADQHHRLAAVWFADLVGYTRLSRNDEGAAVRLVQTFQLVTRRLVARHGGRIVKFLGDGALAEFASTDDAVRSASEMIGSLDREAEARGIASVWLRIGVHVGDVVATSDGDLYGDGINVAARIQAEAEPGEAWAREDVWRQLRQRPEFRFEPRGERELRGIDAPLKLYAVTVESGPAIGVARKGRPPWREPRAPWWKAPRPAWLATGGVVAVLVLGTILWPGRDRNPSRDNVVPAEASAIRARTVAVLPFDNMSEEPGNEYFADGIADDVLTSLSKVGDLRVISRTSSLAYRGTTKPLREIAAELGAGAILEGSVRRIGDRVRITVQLIDGRTDPWRGGRERRWPGSSGRTNTAIWNDGSSRWMLRSTTFATPPLFASGGKRCWTTWPGCGGPSRRIPVSVHESVPVGNRSRGGGRPARAVRLDYHSVQAYFTVPLKSAECPRSRPTSS